MRACYYTTIYYYHMLYDTRGISPHSRLFPPVATRVIPPRVNRTSDAASERCTTQLPILEYRVTGPPSPRFSLQLPETHYQVATQLGGGGGVVATTIVATPLRLGPLGHPRFWTSYAGS